MKSITHTAIIGATTEATKTLIGLTENSLRSDLIDISMSVKTAEDGTVIISVQLGDDDQVTQTTIKP